MKKNTIGSLAVLTLTIAGFGFASCEKGDKKPPGEVKDITIEKNTEEKSLPPASGQAPTHAPAAANAPGTLKAIMVDLGDEMNTLQSGLWLEDYEVVSASAMKVANHPNVSDEEKIRVMTAMGADMSAFVTIDKLVHNGAVALSEAAESKDMPKTLEALAALQKNCVDCHSSFRSRLTTTK